MQIKSVATTLDLSPEEALRMGLNLRDLLQGSIHLNPTQVNGTSADESQKTAAAAGPIGVGPRSPYDDEAFREVRRRVLRRMPIPDGQRDLFKVLSAAPEGLLYSELAARMDRRRDELAGVLGAFGRRINNTAGFPKVDKNAIALFLDFEMQGNECLYRLRPDARGDLADEGLI